MAAQRCDFGEAGIHFVCILIAGWLLLAALCLVLVAGRVVLSHGADVQLQDVLVLNTAQRTERMCK